MNITANGNKNAKLFLVRYGVRTASPSNGSLFAGNGNSLLITKAPNKINPVFIVLFICFCL